MPFSSVKGCSGIAVLCCLLAAASSQAQPRPQPTPAQRSAGAPLGADGRELSIPTGPYEIKTVKVSFASGGGGRPLASRR